MGAKRVSNVERSPELPLPVLRVNVIVLVEIELLGVERDLGCDEEVGRGRERMGIFRRQPINSPRHYFSAEFRSELTPVEKSDLTADTEQPFVAGVPVDK